MANEDQSTVKNMGNKTKSLLSQELKNKDEIQALYRYIQGDEECFVCRGVTYTTKKSRSNGNPVVCIGFKSKLKSLSVEQTVKLDKETSGGNMVSYFGIGNCFYTKRIERLGYSPILGSGFEQKRVLLDEVKSNNIKQAKVTDSKHVEGISPDHLRDDEIIPIARGVTVMMINISRAGNRLTKQMNLTSMHSSALTLCSDMPQMFFRGITKFYLTSAKMQRRMTTNFNRWFNNNQTPST